MADQPRSDLPAPQAPGTDPVAAEDAPAPGYPTGAVPPPTGFTAQVPHPVPVRRPTPWWAVLTAVLAGLLVVGMSGAVGFGLGFAVGSRHEVAELRDGFGQDPGRGFGDGLGDRDLPGQPFDRDRGSRGDDGDA